MTDRIEKFAIVDKIEKGYTRIPNATMQDPNLTDSAYRVLSFLLSINKGFNPTIKKIAKSLHMTEKKVQRAITLLKSTGYISVKRYKNGSLYGGIQWQISNFPGHFNTDKNNHIYVDKNDVVENVQTCTYKINPTCTDKNDQTCTDKNDVVENVHISQQPIGQQPSNVNNHQMSNTNECQLPLLQTPTEDAVEEVSSQWVKGENFGLGSSEAKASPLQGKSQGNSEQVISQTEYLFRQLREKYPPHRLGDYAAGLKAFRSIPDINMVYPEIIQGLENWKQSESWSNEDGRYVPGLAKFLNERKWKTPPIWNNNASGTNDYANSDTRKAVAQKWHQLETRNNTTIGEGE